MNCNPDTRDSALAKPSHSPRPHNRARGPFGGPPSGSIHVKSRVGAFTSSAHPRVTSIAREDAFLNRAPAVCRRLLSLSRCICALAFSVARALMNRDTSNSSSACDERALNATVRALLFATNIS